MRVKSTTSGRLNASHKKEGLLSAISSFALWIFGAVAGITVFFIATTAAVFQYMYQFQPTPYLDEVFHIPQARKYCDGNFTSWDPKITTLPGLYILSVGFLKPFAWIFSQPEICTSVHSLRSCNIPVSLAMLYILVVLLKHVHGTKDQIETLRRTITALNICIFPVLYFFNFLYYTDVLSTFLILLAYLLCAEQRYITSSVVGFVSVLVRQTNIVWVAFMGLLAFAEILKSEAHINRKKFTVPILRSSRYIEMLWGSLHGALTNGAAAKAFLLVVLHRLSGYIVVGTLFLSFVVYNGSLVVGDKQAHQATIHITQCLYFTLFFLAFTFPLALPYAFNLHRTLRRRAKTVVVMIIVMCLIIYFNTKAHPYLLADNRHYTFYLWKRVINRTWHSRYELIPLYLLGTFWIGSILKRTDYVFRIGFVLCFILSIVPQGLLEFRYFIIPYVLLRIHVYKPEMWQLLAEFALHSIVNVSTVLLYTKRTIIWSDMDEPQRFLW